MFKWWNNLDLTILFVIVCLVYYTARACITGYHPGDDEYGTDEEKREALERARREREEDELYWHLNAKAITLASAHCEHFGVLVGKKYTGWTRIDIGHL